ncbi:MAG: phosphonate ABC transporter, permease protein PhnE [Tissierellia bacterium]|nr:phosphonate ABC transporter, permease protein PhnE [Tissierellia bacterium]
MNLYDRIFKPRPMTLSNGKVVYEKRSRTPLVLLILLLLTYGSMRMTGFSLYTLQERGVEFFNILGKIFHPNLSFMKHIWGPLFDTIKMSFLGSFCGAFFAMFFAYLASTNMIKSKFVVMPVRFLFSLIRTIPTLVNALIATYIFGLGTLAGTIAIFLFSFSYVGKLMYEQIETVDMGPFEAMMSMGFSKPRAFYHGILVQILPNYLSVSLYNFEGNVRYAAILGYVGAGGIGLMLSENISWRQWDNVGTILLAVFGTVFVIESISTHFRKKLN